MCGHPCNLLTQMGVMARARADRQALRLLTTQHRDMLRRRVAEGFAVAGKAGMHWHHRNAASTTNAVRHRELVWKAFKGSLRTVPNNFVEFHLAHIHTILTRQPGPVGSSRYVILTLRQLSGAFKY